MPKVKKKKSRNRSTLFRQREVIIRRLELKGLKLEVASREWTGMEKGGLKDVAFHHKLLSSV